MMEAFGRKGVSLKTWQSVRAVSRGMRGLKSLANPGAHCFHRNGGRRMMMAELLLCAVMIVSATGVMWCRIAGRRNSGGDTAHRIAAGTIPESHRS